MGTVRLPLFSVESPGGTVAWDNYLELDQRSQFVAFN